MFECLQLWHLCVLHCLVASLSEIAEHRVQCCRGLHSYIGYRCQSPFLFSNNTCVQQTWHMV
jgi:hypothetical protein